jgi:hypothetical protein
MRIRKIAGIAALTFLPLTTGAVGLTTTVANAATSNLTVPTACSATIGGTITQGNAGNYNAYSTYLNCTTWRAYARCKQTGTTNGVYRYGTWRSTVGLHSIAGCLNGYTIIAAGWQDQASGILHGQWP